MGYDEHLRAQTPNGGMSERVHSPWTGDYDFPHSAGPVSNPSLSFLSDSNWSVKSDANIVGLLQAEEQQVDETDEQFEERVLNKRAYQMFTVVRQKLQQQDQLTLSDMCHRNTKKQVSFTRHWFLVSV